MATAKQLAVRAKFSAMVKAKKGKNSVSKKPVVKSKTGGLMLHQKLARGQKIK